MKLIPSAPSFPGAPVGPGAPSVPSLPGAPVGPGAPSVPSIPSFPLAPVGPGRDQTKNQDKRNQTNKIQIDPHTLF